MPPKLRKEKPTQGSKITPTRTANKFEILSEADQTKIPAKTNPDHTSIQPSPNQTSDDQMAAMQNDLASMVQVIKSLSVSMKRWTNLT